MNSIADIAFPVQLVAQSRLPQIDFANLTFGKEHTDHIFLAEYKDGQWQNARIEPMHMLSLSPFALCLHYGQTVFEGMKAFRMQDGKVNVFRPTKHLKRFNASLERLCMAQVPEELFVPAVAQLAALEQAWIPNSAEASLYMRPFMIATEARIGVKVSEEYLFMVVASPANKYYAKPLRLKVETEFVRAANGGTGFAKCGGNYAAAFFPTEQAKAQGFDQVIWTDARTNSFLEESGTMNIMLIVDGEIHTPALSDSILDGITRDSFLAIARQMGMTVHERRISIAELEGYFEAGKRVEAFGTGTAAVVAPIELIDIGGKEYRPYLAEDATMYILKQALGEIRTGLRDDTFGWNMVL